MHLINGYLFKPGNQDTGPYTQTPDPNLWKLGELVVSELVSRDERHWLEPGLNDCVRLCRWPRVFTGIFPFFLSTLVWNWVPANPNRNTYQTAEGIFLEDFGFSRFRKKIILIARAQSFMVFRASERKLFWTRLVGKSTFCEETTFWAACNRITSMVP